MAFDSWIDIRVSSNTGYAGSFSRIINKVMDYLITNAAEHIALVGNTVRMTRYSRKDTSIGVYPIDFEMKDELLKPWTAIINLVKRRRVFRKGASWKSKWAHILQFVLFLASSVCFVLQGAAMNAIGLPKARWFPDNWASRELLAMSTARMNLASIEWIDSTWNAGWSIVGNGSQPLEAANALAAASAYIALGSLSRIYQNQPRGWWGVIENRTFITDINTNFSNTTVRSISIQGRAALDMYNHARNADLNHAKSSAGMIGLVNLTLPMLTTTCSASTASTSSAETISVANLATSASKATLRLHIGALAGIDFAGATCNLVLQQIFFPFDFWQASSNPGDLNIPVDGHQKSNFSSTVVSPPSITDAANLHHLATRFSLLLPYLDNLLPKSSFAQQVVLAARHLQDSIPGFESEPESIAPVVAFTMQHIITTARWNMTASPTEIVTSYPIQYYVYGSGPRVKWEWAAGVILSVIILLLCYDVYITLRHRVAPGAWLTLAGMMSLANSSERMESVRTSCGILAEDCKRTKYYIRESFSDSAQIVDDTSKGIVLGRGKIYGETTGDFRT